MRTAQIGFKTTTQVKIKAQKLTDQLGVSLSSVLNGFLNQFIRSERLELSIDPQPSQFALDMIAESEKDIKKGRMSSGFNNAKDAIVWLNNKNRKYENQL